MTSFKEYLKESVNKLEVVEAGFVDLFESTAASTMTGGVANPDAKPLFKKSSFAGHPCLTVDDATYSACINGKKPFKHWRKFIQDDERLRDELKTMYQKNRRVLIKNSKTGAMVYVK